MRLQVQFIPRNKSEIKTEMCCKLLPSHKLRFCKTYDLKYFLLEIIRQIDYNIPIDKRIFSADYGSKISLSEWG
jgi:hypothetical protein